MALLFLIGHIYEVNLIAFKRYRIGIINDFRNSHAFMDFQDYGTLQVFDCSYTEGAHKGFQEARDSIGVFLNFALIEEFKDKSSALNLVYKLIKECPKEGIADFQAHYKVIIQGLD